MTPRTWLGIGLGTLISAIGIWFGILALTASTPTGLVIFATAIVLASFSMAGFSGSHDPMGTGFRASLLGLLSGIAMFVMFDATGNDLYMVIAPVVVLGLSGTFSLAPTEPRLRSLIRLLLLVPFGAIAWLVFWVDPVVYGMIIPLMPLPAVGLGDRVFDRAVSVIAEDPIRGTDESGE